MDDFSLTRPAGHLIMGGGSWPDGLAKKDGAQALSGAESVDTATTQLDKPSRTKNLIIEYKASDFHAVFSDHTLRIQKHHCSNPDCRWHSTPTIKSLFGSNIHPDLAILHCEQGAWYSYREAEKNLETWNGHPRRVNNHMHIIHHRTLFFC